VAGSVTNQSSTLNAYGRFTQRTDSDAVPGRTPGTEKSNVSQPDVIAFRRASAIFGISKGLFHQAALHNIPCL